VHGARQYDRAVLRPTLTITVAAVLLCAACSSGDGFGITGESGGTGLRAALGRVAANDQTRQYVEYGDVARLSKLAGDGERYITLLGYGFSPLANTYKIMAKELRFDPTKMDGAVLAGQPPDQAGVLWGDYDVDALERALADRDIASEDSGDGKRWKVADDQEIDFEGPLVDIVPTAGLNSIQTGPGVFAYSSTRAGVDSVTAPGDDTLADDPLMGRLAGCLGDVSAAVLTTKVEGDPMSYGVGARIPADGAATEVACLAPVDGDAKALRDKVEQELKNGVVPSVRKPWAELLPNATVELVENGSVVRIEAKPADGPVGRVIQLLQNRDLPALAGSRR
jgi:hypothetical protein